MNRLLNSNHLRQKLHSIYKAIFFVSFYVLISCFSSILQANYSSYSDDNNSIETILITLSNCSHEIDIIDAEEEPEDYKKIASRLNFVTQHLIKFTASIQLKKILNLSLPHENLIITQIDLPPPVKV